MRRKQPYARIHREGYDRVDLLRGIDMRHGAHQKTVSAWGGEIAVKWHYIAPGRPIQNGYVETFTGRMRDELRNERPFLSLDHVRVAIAAGVEDYNRERPHSSVDYETPAAFAAWVDKQWPASLRSAGSATQRIASAALMRNNEARLKSRLGETAGYVTVTRTCSPCNF